MKAKRPLHQPPPGLREAEAMPDAKRRRTRNRHSPFGGMHTWMPEDVEAQKFRRKHKGG